MKKTFTILAAVLALVTGCAQSQNCKEAEETNPVIDAIMARRSIRHYKETPVSRDTLKRIAECGVNAPNAMNHQDWEVRIIDDNAYFEGITEVMKAGMPFLVDKNDPKFRNSFRNCTAAIAIACPDDESGMFMQNVGLMSQNICLAAQSLGLGTCIMGGPAIFMNRNEEAKPYLDRLQFSEGYKLRVIIALGYPDEEPEARPRDLTKIRFVD